MNEFLKKWNDEIDDLELDISLGEDEVIETFEKHKSSMRDYLTGLAGSIDEKFQDLDIKDKATGVKTKLEELQVQLALGRAETRDAYEEQKEKLEQKLQEAKAEYEHLKDNSGEKYQSMAGDFGDQVEKFKTKLDVFRLHFALGSADVQDDLSEKKEELKGKLAEMKKKIEASKEDAEDKWDDFSDELSESFTHFKGAIKGLFS